MRNLLDAVLLDFDGTLVDSAPDFIAALNRLLAEMGHEPVGFEAYRNLAGAGAKRLLRSALGADGEAMSEADILPWVKRLIGYYYEVETERARAFPGVVETLGGLRRAGLALGVCTNKPDASTRRLLHHLEMTHLFGVVLGGDAVAAMKPDPGHLDAALDVLGVPRARAAMVGDSATDVAAAHAAGLKVVAVSYGYSPVPAHELGADAVIGHFSELPAALAALG